MKNKQQYLDSLKVGQIVAFKINDKMISAKVSYFLKDGSVEVETKNGSKYYIKTEEISWVKTGARWPAGIYNALKANKIREEVNSDEQTEGEHKSDIR